MLPAVLELLLPSEQGGRRSKGPHPRLNLHQQPKKRKMSAEGLANIRAGVAKRLAAQSKAVQKPKRKMSAAWRKALEKAWAARRAKGKAAKKAKA